ncbi:MAG: zinc ribbon domain-containing protein [Actinobacteria bacterium]|nr:zinc ribbon domain-containing protein [Actinomycetota bacterium]
MPTYQFVCNDCGRDYEFFLTRMLRDGDELCPDCGSTNVRRAYRDFFGYRVSHSSGESSGGYSSGSSCSSSG